MPMEKIDVCIVTRDGKIPIGLEYIPIKELIINTDKPIGVARKLCIQQVKTPIFAFIDDDMKIDKYWFAILYSVIKRDDVGAVWGTTTGEGYGWFNKFSYDYIGVKELKHGERFNTNNCLIKTELIKDWIASYGLNCYEDLDIGNHIIDKGYKVLFIPSTAIHYKGWSGLKRSALWAGYRWVEGYQNSNKIREYIRRIFAPFWIMMLKGIPASIYAFYRNFWFIIGMVKKDFKLEE